MPIYTWTMTASHQSQVPIVFSLATILLAVTLPVVGGLLWLLFKPPRQELSQASGPPSCRAWRRAASTRIR